MVPANEADGVAEALGKWIAETVTGPSPQGRPPRDGDPSQTLGESR